MIGYDSKKIGDNKIKGKPGGDTNESRFFTTRRELRKHKVVIIPSANTNHYVKLEQGWNRKAREKDVVRITINRHSAIVTREELEQSIASIAQGYETIKYQSPRLDSGENFIKKQINKLT